MTDKRLVISTIKSIDKNISMSFAVRNISKHTLLLAYRPSSPNSGLVCVNHTNERESFGILTENWMMNEIITEINCESNGY